MFAEIVLKRGNFLWLSEKKISKVFCFLSWGHHKRYDHFVYENLIEKPFSGCRQRRFHKSVIWGEDQQSVSFLLENMARLDVRRSNIPDFSRVSLCRKIWRRVCMRSLSLTTACRCCMPSPAPIFLCQYNSIIASLWQYNCYHCELGENLKL